MSIEAMWFLKSASYADPDTMKDGGVVILETERIFGGDSIMAYIGKYTVNGNELKAIVRSFSWNDEYGGENVFGMEVPIDTEVGFQGTISPDHNTINGSIFLLSEPDIMFDTIMVKVADLP